MKTSELKKGAFQDYRNELDRVWKALKVVAEHLEKLEEKLTYSEKVSKSKKLTGFALLQKTNPKKAKAIHRMGGLTSAKKKVGIFRKK